MTGNLNWNDPASIAAWWAIFPARHGALIAWKRKHWPEFADSIMAAGQMLRTGGKA
jgi:hypothetical protein